MNNLMQRIISALVLAPIVLGLVYMGGYYVWGMIAVAACILYWEWVNLTKMSKQRLLWWAIGIPYIVIPCIALAYLSHLSHLHIFSILFFIWAVDIGAYAAGRTIGGPKIAPKISPKKTWAGLFGAMIASSAVMFGVFSTTTFHMETTPVALIVLCCIFSILAQAGDFFESWVKRTFDVKDSSNIIPGHGGLLDRLDGLLFIAPFVAFMAHVTFAG